MTITLAEAQHRLHTLAESQPHKKGVGTDGDCRYFEYDNTPSCIVGHAFATELTEAGVQYGTHTNTEAFADIAPLLSVDTLAVAYLTLAQEQQDFGIPWVDAVKYADEDIANRIAEQLIGDGFEIDPDGQLALAI